MNNKHTHAVRELLGVEPSYRAIKRVIDATGFTNGLLKQIAERYELSDGEAAFVTVLVAMGAMETLKLSSQQVQVVADMMAAQFEPEATPTAKGGVA